MAPQLNTGGRVETRGDIRIPCRGHRMGLLACFSSRSWTGRVGAGPAWGWRRPVRQGSRCFDRWWRLGRGRCVRIYPVALRPGVLGPRGTLHGIATFAPLSATTAPAAFEAFATTTGLCGYKRISSGGESGSWLECAVCRGEVGGGGWCRRAEEGAGGGRIRKVGGRKGSGR